MGRLPAMGRRLPAMDRRLPAMDRHLATTVRLRDMRPRPADRLPPTNTHPDLNQAHLQASKRGLAANPDETRPLSGAAGL
jgi:hypothetical protein